MPGRRGRGGAEPDADAALAASGDPRATLGDAHAVRQAEIARPVFSSGRDTPRMCARAGDAHAPA
jgi:hypothetical protein